MPPLFILFHICRSLHIWNQVTWTVQNQLFIFCVYYFMFDVQMALGKVAHFLDQPSDF